MQWKFREMTDADISWVMEIEREVFSNSWSEISFKEELTNPYSFCFLVWYNGAENKSERVGYCCFHQILDEMHILKLAVAKKYQKKGGAGWLLKKCTDAAQMKGASTVFLEVRPSNTAAMRFYQKFGFKVIGKRPNYYAKDREDALVLQNDLKEALL